MKKISIIIVSYNEIDYLINAIESLLHQVSSYDYEIIIGDDGSSDGSIDVIKEYANRYPQDISYFVMKRETVDARNIIPSIRVSNVLKRAFEIAKGDYLVLLSADDINIDNQRIFKQVEFLENHKKYMSCYCDYKKFWNNGEEEKCIFKSSLTRSVFWGGAYVHISCFVFRRLCLENVLERFCDDTGMIFSILKTGKSKHIPFMGFGYRQRDKSIMHEADYMELSLLELLLFQDCLNQGYLTKSSKSRFSKPLNYVFLHRKELGQTKYLKYINDSHEYKNDLIRKIQEYDDLKGIKKFSLIKLLVFSKLYYCFFRIARKINTLFFYFLKI